MMINPVSMFSERKSGVRNDAILVEFILRIWKVKFCITIRNGS